MRKSLPLFGLQLANITSCVQQIHSRNLPPGSKGKIAFWRAVMFCHRLGTVRRKQGHSYQIAAERGEHFKAIRMPFSSEQRNNVLCRKYNKRRWSVRGM
uniref:Secreted protein n=1 Tax=Trichuris muris TaxID=70415 RepID=A0A5S6Q1G2_TRIMR